MIAHLHPPRLHESLLVLQAAQCMVKCLHP
jgi:hypothetical protein